MIFGRDMILPIHHIESWRYIRQRKKTQIEKDVIREESTRIDYNYIVGDQVTIRNKSAYKNETHFKRLYGIFKI